MINRGNRENTLKHLKLNKEKQTKNLEEIYSFTLKNPYRIIGTPIILWLQFLIE